MDIDFAFWRRFRDTNGWPATLDALRMGLWSGALSARDVDRIMAVLRAERVAA